MTHHTGSDEGLCRHIFPDGTRCNLTDHSAPGLAATHAAARAAVKGYGVSRWDYPRVRPCDHPGCPRSSRVLRTGEACPEIGRAHNCCDEDH